MSILVDEFLVLVVVGVIYRRTKAAHRFKSPLTTLRVAPITRLESCPYYAPRTRRLVVLEPRPA